MAKRVKKVAIVHCRGGAVISDGCSECSYGCIGCGSCVSACRLQAIVMGEDEIPVVSGEKCVGCGLCVKACPRQVISIGLKENVIRVKCSNKDAGPQARKVCQNSCIGCGICEKNCPAGAVHVTDHCAVIDQEKCIACGMCAVKCPREAIRDVNGIFTVG